MPLDPVPAHDALATTRRSWHLLAAHVVAEERFRRVGHSGLEATPQGFRTPSDEPVGVEVERDHLVVRGIDGKTRREVTTIGDAQSFVLGEVGPPHWGQQPGLHDPPPAIDADTPLPIDTEVAAWLGNWFILGQLALRDLVDDPVSTDAGIPTLWPEHFDIGTELLAQDRRASYGLSAGDDIIATPYAYVVPWALGRTAAPRDPRWNNDALSGASITAGELATETDAATRLLIWFRERRDLLLAGPD
ncbi:MAG: hypothetical protein WD360_08000 [Nitriliruptoraceae bacterium]